MRRCPDKDDQDQQQSCRVDAVGHRSPPEQWWSSAGGSTDNDILRCRPLQPRGIDDRIANQGEKRQYCGQGIHPLHQ
jgi:hypothetical protein